MLGKALWLAHVTVEWRKLTLNARFAALPHPFVKMDSLWLFAERLLYVDWLGESHYHEIH